MTNSQKNLIKKLLTGHFLRRQVRHNKEWYILYDGRTNPIEKIKPSTVDRITRFFNSRTKLWKRSKAGSITLNLNTVRGLHGNHTIKKLYKKKGTIETAGSIYKRRKKYHKSKNNTDEKVHTLF